MPPTLDMLAVSQIRIKDIAKRVAVRYECKRKTAFDELIDLSKAVLLFLLGKYSSLIVENKAIAFWKTKNKSSIIDTNGTRF